MIAADSSSMIAYFANHDGNDIEEIDYAISNRSLILPPLVVSELYSNVNLPEDFAGLISSLPTLEIFPGYWQRCGIARATLLKHKLKARIADSLIAQICIDHDVSLITRDYDFRHFTKHCGLKIIGLNTIH